MLDADAWLLCAAQDKFCREVAILRSCRNSNIVQFQGACVAQGATMLVTEFMEARCNPLRGCQQIRCPLI